jgi:hypothetical protein
MPEFITKHYNWMLMSRQIREDYNGYLLNEFIEHRRNFSTFEEFITWWSLPEANRVRAMRGVSLPSLGDLI